MSEKFHADAFMHDAFAKPPPPPPPARLRAHERCARALDRLECGPRRLHRFEGADDAAQRRVQLAAHVEPVVACRHDSRWRARIPSRPRGAGVSATQAIARPSHGSRASRSQRSDQVADNPPAP